MARNPKFIYDVFISYRHNEPSKSWVRNILTPRLEEEGFSIIIDYRDFRLGAPLISEMIRAVTDSKYTLAVFTPAYLESDFTELESIMAEHIGLEKRQRRMLAIMREKCKPRLSIQSRLWLDMMDDSKFEEALNYLVRQLQQPPSK